jgi:hypothetical protein
MKRLRRWLEEPWVLWAAVALGFLLTTPALWGGLYFDDYILRIARLGHPEFPETPTSPLQLFSFMVGEPEQRAKLMDRLVGIWGLDENLQVAFMRPLSSLTHAVDFWLWPNAPWLMHLQSLLWYGILIYLVSRYYRRILGPNWVAGLAMLFYAIDDAHGLTVGWISNRNALVAGVFGVGALLAHDRWRRDGWLPGIWVASILFVLALLGAESAIAVCAFVFAYSVFLEEGPWRRRISGLVPYGLVVIVWRVVYTGLGYGVAGTDLYVDPVKEPLVYGLALVERLPVFLLGQFALPPAEAWIVVSDRGRALLTLSGTVFVIVVLVLSWPILKCSREARFFGLGTILATVPLCATYPFDRLLVFVGVGAMGLVASFTSEIRVARGVRGAGAYVLAVTWFVLHGLIAPILLPVRALYPSELDAIMARVDATLPRDEALRSQTLVVVNTPDFSLSFYLLMRRAALEEPLPGFVRFLSITAGEIVVEREDEHTLSLRFREALFTRPMERMFRGRRSPFEVGDTYRLSGFAARVMEVTEEGRPTAVQFQFAKPLEDDSLRWVSWEGRGFVPFALPRIGEKKVLQPVDIYALVSEE